MSEPPTPNKKVAISQFQIKNVTDVNNEPVTPVKIAPPPLTVKRSKSLKSDRTKFKRYVSAPGKSERVALTLPRQTTAPELKQHNTEQNQTNEQDEKSSVEPQSTPESVECEVSENGTKVKVEDKVEKKSIISNQSNGDSAMPEPASWQAVVNTHRRGSSMTFVSTQNWAQFDAGPVAVKESPPPEFCWDITEEQWRGYEDSFHSIKPLHGFISGKQSKEYLINTGLSRESLAKIWDLADMDHDGSLSLAEFAVAMHCVSAVECAVQLPLTVPGKLRDSLLFHVSNRNNLLSSLNKTEKSPEKSSLKTVGSASKGANVTFREDSSTCDTLPRRRPRPSRKLVTTTPLHLKPQPVLSSSSYYSSDNSEEESEPVSKKLDLTDMSDKKKDKKDRKDRKKKNRSSESDSRKEGKDSPSSEHPEAKIPVRRERTYEDVDDFRNKVEIEEGDEDVEALLPSSDDESRDPTSRDPAMSPPPPPQTRAPTRQPSRPDFSPPTRVPSGPPPSSPPSSSHLAEEEGSPVEVTTTSAEECGTSSDREKSLNHDTTGYERLAEEHPEFSTPTILLNEGEMISDESDEDTNGDLTPRDTDLTPRDTDLTPRDTDLTPHETDLMPRDTDLTPRDTDFTPHETDLTPHDTDLTPRDTDLTARDTDLTPRDTDITSRDNDVTICPPAATEPSVEIDREEHTDELPEVGDDVRPSADDVILVEEALQDETREVEEAADGHTELPILRLEQPAAARANRSGSVDSAMLSYCPDNTDNVQFRVPDFLSEDVCSNKLQLEELQADEDELKADYDKRMWNFDEAEKTEPDFDQLKETDLNELRTMIRDYELHNDALFNLARELRIELLKVQEQKHHLQSTLKCMKKA